MRHPTKVWQRPALLLALLVVVSSCDAGKVGGARGNAPGGPPDALAGGGREADAQSGGGADGGAPIDSRAAADTGVTSRDMAAIADAGSRPPVDAGAPIEPPPARDAGGAGAGDAAAASARSVTLELMGRIQEDDVRARFGELEAISRPNRATGTASYRRATEWIRDLLARDAPALTVRFDESGSYRNVEIVLKGSDPTAGIYMFGGHLDSVTRSPGMDDNGSGSLGAALVARALASYRFKAEVRALLFDAEEIGLVGSGLYARALRSSGCEPGSCLKFYLNMDMVGHDPNNRRNARILTVVPEIRMLLTRVASEFMLGLTVSSGGDECNSSDDCSFSRQGYATGYLIEGTFFQNRHTPADTNEVINFTTLTKVLQMVSGAMATAAAIEGRR